MWGEPLAFSHEANPSPTSVQFIVIYRAKIKVASGSVAGLQCPFLKSVQYSAAGQVCTLAEPSGWLCTSVRVQAGSQRSRLTLM